MAKNNPANPHSRDSGETKRDVPMPISKATVESADSHPNEDGYHKARIRVYGESSPYNAPVMPLTIGSAWIPQPDTDVAVLFGASDKPIIIGPWYPPDRVTNGEVDLPEYEPGEFVLGNGSGAEIRFDLDGNIHLSSSDDGSVFIDGVEQ